MVYGCHIILDHTKHQYERQTVNVNSLVTPGLLSKQRKFAIKILQTSAAAKRSLASSNSFLTPLTETHTDCKNQRVSEQFKV